jgi:hypothetical protein
MWHYILALFSDPENQNALKWIFSGVGAVVLASWAVFRFFYEQRRYTRPEGPQPKTRSGFQLLAIGGVIAVLLIVVFATVSFWPLQGMGADSTNCYKLTKISIKTPLDGAQISASNEVFAIVNGEATPNQSCRFVYVFVKDMRSGTLRASDLTQTLDNGEWSGRLDLSNVAHGELAGVHAVLIDRPIYPVGTTLPLPPVGGRPSQHVQLWRQ